MIARRLYLYEVDPNGNNGKVLDVLEFNELDADPRIYDYIFDYVYALNDV